MHKFTVLHTNIICCLTLIERKKLLASGSADSVKLWKLEYIDTASFPKNEA